MKLIGLELNIEGFFFFCEMDMLGVAYRMTISLLLTLTEFQYLNI